MSEQDGPDLHWVSFSLFGSAGVCIIVCHIPYCLFLPCQNDKDIHDLEKEGMRLTRVHQIWLEFYDQSITELIARNFIEHMITMKS